MEANKSTDSSIMSTYQKLNGHLSVDGRIKPLVIQLGTASFKCPFSTISHIKEPNAKKTLAKQCFIEADDQ